MPPYAFRAPCPQGTEADAANLSRIVLTRKMRPLSYPDSRSRKSMGKVPLPTPSKPGCAGKKRHPTAGAAIGFACRTARLCAGVRPYECPHCRGWHLTTQVAPRRNAR